MSRFVCNNDNYLHQAQTHPGRSAPRPSRSMTSIRRKNQHPQYRLRSLLLQRTFNIKSDRSRNTLAYFANDANHIRYNCSSPCWRYVLPRLRPGVLMLTHTSIQWDSALPGPLQICHRYGNSDSKFEMDGLESGRGMSPGLYSCEVFTNVRIAEALVPKEWIIQFLLNLLNAL